MLDWEELKLAAKQNDPASSSAPLEGRTEMLGKQGWGSMWAWQTSIMSWRAPLCPSVRGELGAACNLLV